MQKNLPDLEPWMRNTHLELDPVRRAVVHALELAEEDLSRWCMPLGPELLFKRPFSMPSVAFHARHLARSLDRLTTYARGNSLTEFQLAELASEEGPGEVDALWAEVESALSRAASQVRAVDPASFAEPRGIGRKQLPTTVGGLLIHCAEHTSRHVGQAVTTSKLVTAISAVS